MGQCRRAHHCRTSRAARSACSAVCLSSVPVCELFPPAQCKSSFCVWSDCLELSRFSIASTDGDYSSELSCHVKAYLLTFLPPCFFFPSHPPMADHPICRFTVSCAKSTYGTSILISMIRMLVLGVRPASSGHLRGPGLNVYPVPRSPSHFTA